MIFKHFHDGFYLNNFASGFSQSFQFCSHIACENIHQHIVHVLGVACLITMVKPFDGVRPIVVGEALYYFDGYKLCFQFYYTFLTHSLYQFGIETKRECEANFHGI